MKDFMLRAQILTCPDFDEGVVGFWCQKIVGAVRTALSYNTSSNGLELWYLFRQAFGATSRLYVSNS